MCLAPDDSLYVSVRGAFSPTGGGAVGGYDGLWHVGGKIHGP